MERLKIDKVFVLLGAIFLTALCLPVVAQDESSIRLIIKEADIKELDKAASYKENAEKLIEEANGINMEVLTLQSGADQDDKAAKKKTAQLENSAVQKQIQASALYAKSNELRFGLYKRYIDGFWKNHAGEENNYLNAKLLEEQASGDYYEAANARSDAKKMDDGYAKVEKLNQANDLENQAIEKQVKALSAYFNLGETLAETPSTPENTAVSPGDSTPQINPEPADSNVLAVDTLYTTTEQPQVVSPESHTEQTLPGNIEVNQSMIDAYNRYIAAGQFNDTTIRTGKISGITSFDADNILQIWYEYLYGNNAFWTTPQALASDTIGQGKGAEASVSKAPETSGLGEASKAAGDKEIGIVTDENVGSLVPADEEVIYRVQLAANRSELTQRTLSKMYYGNKQVETVNENGWYKYSVGDFSTYAEANQFRKSTGIKNAFVIAYRKGARRTETAAKEVGEASQTRYTPPAEGQRMPAGLVFRIQVAANRVPMTVSQLKRIYPGAYPVEMISEEGWYKYQLMGVRLFSDALQIARGISSPGAFIVAYEDGVKANLADAVKKNKELEESVRTKGRSVLQDEVEFHLQIAASKTVMPADELKSIYNGAEPVSIIYEEGWYKYHIKAGNSAELAEQFKQSCGIPKAFIVPYKRATKINYFEAIQESKK
jgi:hypothetical protein